MYYQASTDNFAYRVSINQIKLAKNCSIVTYGCNCSPFAMELSRYLEQYKLREFRHALPVAVNERVVKNRQRKIGTDMAVSDANFRSFLRFYQQKLNESKLDYVIFGHIGDNHLHANMLPKNDEEATAAKHLYGRFVAQAIMLGGTISAEHGIGKLKSKYLHAQYGERFLNEMAELKKAFDPHGILGRDNMFAGKHLS